MQVPESEVRFKEFDTGFTDKNFVEKLLKEVKTSDKKKDAEEEYKDHETICKENDISLDQLQKVIFAEKSAKGLDGGKFILSGNVRVTSRGKVARCYCRAGELMVQCIQDAYRDELKFDVPITGEYLFGKSWGDCH